MPPSRIVVRAPNWLGDIVMAMPAIAAIRRHFPQATLAVAAPASFASFCRALPGVDEVTPLEGRGVRALSAHAAALAAGRFDLAILLTNSFISALEVRRAGIPERWGVRRDFRGPLLTRGVARPRKGQRVRGAEGQRDRGAEGQRDRGAEGQRDRGAEGQRDRGAEGQRDRRAEGQKGKGAEGQEAGRGFSPAVSDEIPGAHHSRYYLRIVEALGIPTMAAFGALEVDDDVREQARRQLVELGWTGDEALVALAPGAAYGGAKRWPATHAADAIRALQASGVRTVLVGAGADRDAARAIESALADAPRGAATAAGRDAGPAVLNLVGETDLTRLMGVFSWCRVVLANDSGAMHVASAVGRPVVAVFGPTDEAATSPLGRHTIVRHDVWCRPCLLRECPLDHACMEGVAGAQVAAAAASWLGERGTWEQGEGETA